MESTRDWRWLTIDEAAKLLKVSRSTIRMRLKDGGLRGYRFGRLIRLRSDDLDKVGEPINGTNNQ